MKSYLLKVSIIGIPKKKAVVIDLEKHGALWEDFCDVLRAKERENEPRESLASVKRKITYAWAVRDGDVLSAPIPGAVWLMSSGMISLVCMRRKFKR